MQNTFSPTSKVPIVFRSLNSLQVQSLLKLKVNFLIVSPYKTQKANYILLAHGAEYTFTFQREEWGIVRKYWIKSRLKHSRASS